nr:MAG TPA: Site-specific DNA methylase [Caudoviricetes sp.]
MKYVGSKNRLSKQIAPIIQSYIDNMPDCHGYLEPFVGGANMIDKIKCSCKIGNDVHKYLIVLLNHVSETTDDLPDTITEEEYNAVRTNPSNYPDWYVGLVGFCSFGGKWWGGYPRSFKNDGATPRDMPNEIIRNLKKQAPNLKKSNSSVMTMPKLNHLKPKDMLSTVTLHTAIPPNMQQAISTTINSILGAKKWLRLILY